MAENKVTIELEVTGNAEKKIDDVTTAISTLEKTAKAGFEKAGSSFEVFKGVLEARAVEKGFELITEAAHKLFEVFVVEGIQSAIAQEEAVNKLNQALALSGEYTQEASKDFQEYAEQLQETTTFSNDQIISTGALIESLGNLSEEGLKEATLAAANLAAQLGIDLDTAARKLGQAMETGAASVKKFGVEAEEGETKAETFANVIAAVNEQFAGSAAAKINTFSGATKQLANDFDDLIKVTGEAVVKNQVVIAVIKEVGAVLRGATSATEAQKNNLKSFVAEGVLLAIDATVGLAAALDALYRVGVIAFEGIKGAAQAVGLGLVTAFGGPLALVDSFLAKIPGLGDSFGTLSAKVGELAVSLSADLGNSFNAAAEAATKPTDALVKVEEVALRVREAATGAFTAMSEGAESSVEPINKARDATAELTAEQIKLGEEGLKIQQAALEKDPAEEFNLRLEALSAARDQELLEEQEFLDAKATITEEFQIKEDEFIAKRVEKLRAANEVLIADSASTNATQIAANKASIDTLVANESLSAAQRLKLQQQLAADSKKVETDRLNAGKDAFDQLATFQNAKTKEIAAVGKAAAIASAVISTYEGASKAAAAVAGVPFIGPGLAVAAAAAFIAAGIARVAVITGTQLATGIDSVPGTGTKDNFPAILAPGERVVPRQTNQDLKAFLSDTVGQTEALNSIADRMDRLQNQVVVNIGSKEIVNELNDAQASGRVLI